MIINADDFGFNKEITDGILNCHRAGTVTSTTMMVNMSASDYAAEFVSKCPNLSVGIHLNLTAGRPLTDPSKVRSLVDSNGYFLDHQEMFRRAFRYQLNRKEVETELTRQIEKFIEYGLMPTHCDSHHHIADCPGIFAIKIKLMKRYNIKKIRTQRGWYRRDKRLRMSENMYRTFSVNIKRFPRRLYYEFLHIYSKLNGLNMPDERYGLAKVISSRMLDYTVEDFKVFVENCPEGTVEFVVHPGLLSDDNLDEPAYRIHRKAEYDLLMNPQCKTILNNANVKLTNFNELQE